MKKIAPLLLLAVILIIYTAILWSDNDGSPVSGTIEAELKNTEEAQEQSSMDITEKHYREGFYTVGKNIPAGEYILFATNDKASFSLYSDSSGYDVNSKDSFSYNSIVLIHDGEYFELVNAYAIPFDADPEVDTSGAGMFKVGVHIPAGNYTIEATEKRSSMKVTTNSTHYIYSNITSEVYFDTINVTVTDGQYLTLVRARIVQ